MTFLLSERLSEFTGVIINMNLPEIDLINNAIENRYRLRIKYGLEEIIFEPYFKSTGSVGDRTIFGRVNNTWEIKSILQSKISQVELLDFRKFSPIIPIVHN